MVIVKQEYLPVSSAAEFSSYNSDYLTQMCRKGNLQCLQISKVWFISLNSLKAYLESVKKVVLTSLNQVNEVIEIEEILSGDLVLTINNEEYLNSDKAAKLSSYNRDYLTQLARSGEVRAKKLGKVWFFSRNSLLEHMHKSSKQTYGTDSKKIHRRRLGESPKLVSIAEETNKTGHIPRLITKGLDYELEDIYEDIPHLQERIQEVPIRVKRDTSKQIHNLIRENKNSITEVNLEKSKKEKVQKVFNETRFKDLNNFKASKIELQSRKKQDSIGNSEINNNLFLETYKRPEKRKLNTLNGKHYKKTRKRCYQNTVATPKSIIDNSLSKPVKTVQKRTGVNESVSLDFASQNEASSKTKNSSLLLQKITVFNNNFWLRPINIQVRVISDNFFQIFSYIFIFLSFVLLLLINLMLYGIIDSPANIFVV